MFNWDDQELVNILWAEADHTDDHIVPIPRGCEEPPLDVSGDLIKNQQIANGKASKQKKPVSSSELDAVKQEIFFERHKNEILSAAGHSVDIWNKSLTNVQILQNPNDDKESDLVGYDWDSIGSFEDLDRMFSNGDTEFGCTSLKNADELWSCSVDYSSLASGAPSTSEQCGKTEDMSDQAQPFSVGYSNMNDLTCCLPQKKHATMNHLRHAEFRNNLFVENKISRDMVSETLQVDSNFSTGNVSVPTEFADKMDRQKYILRRRKRSGEESKARPYQDLPKTWFSSQNQLLQLEDHYEKTGQSPVFLGINRQIKFQEPACSPYNNIAAPLFSPSGHTHRHIQDPVAPILPQFHSLKVPSYKSKTLNKFPCSLANPLIMTPEEKIKKLRKRQQLRAMLAIQKQQKQFGHETSESQQLLYHKYTIPDQLKPVGGNLEVDVSTLDMNSPSKQDYSITMSLASDDCSPENAILYRLQDIVAKLDVQLRLCIRDSLCRLAQSATQRQCAKDAGNTMKRSENYLTFLPEEDTNTSNRFARTPEVETDTNPIDRTVAHLLFHRPIEFSENLETAELPRTVKILQERTVTNFLTTTREILAENYNSLETRPDVEQRGLVCAGNEKYKTISYVNMSEYATNCEEVQKEVTEFQPFTNSRR